MIWNWQRAEWPEFVYDAGPLAALEKRFLLNSGEFIGAFRHINASDQDMLRLELISDEALKTSEIEGEILDRKSLQSSLRNQLGLETGNTIVPPRERGIAEMMVDVFHDFASPMTHENLHAWHRMVMADAQRISVIGGYRTHADAMQVVSGEYGNPTVHFEAPPSDKVPALMEGFVQWFNRTSPGGEEPLAALTRASIAHLYFECIHPFEDGNGRIGRAIAEKALAQSLGQPSLIALSFTIERHRKRYYDMLERNNKHLQIDTWLAYFAETILEAQDNTMRRVEFIIAKSRFFDHFGNQLNERQQKALLRMFREGIEGFKGGLSADNYLSITKTSRATATRDLAELVDMGALSRTGERRYTRYHLILPNVGFR